jgi:collagenase-like PrtC family protease
MGRPARRGAWTDAVSQTRIELLAPAKDLETGLAAIDCGADAVYIGAPRFGAREAAGNPLEDIAKLIEYAHRYWAKVYVVVNTLLRDDELLDAVRLIHRIYHLGADALIIQDTGLLECDLPPIPLFASTQMHNHTPERVAFLEQVGFRRAILARELSLEQIRQIRARTSLELETFIHGALCVCYSGQCYLSYAIGGRSGNRGQCAQPCRRRYSLVDASGQVLVKDLYLLSIRDLNLSADLRELLQAGVTSFKIEGRLKDRAYVMNVVAYYRKALDALLPELGLQKSSSGAIELDFLPNPDKTFNRGYTRYFIDGRGEPLESNATPKMVGEPIGRIQSLGRTSFTLGCKVQLHNGDGLTFFDRRGELQGTLVNRVDGRTITPARMGGLAVGLDLYRNHDHDFLTALEKSRPQRKIAVRMTLSATPYGFRLALRDEDGVTAVQDLICEKQPAEKPERARETIQKQLNKLGETEFAGTSLELELDQMVFIPVSALNELRRGAVEKLRVERQVRRPVSAGGMLSNATPYPEKQLTFKGNVLNRQAAAFYRRHGVARIEPAAESGLDLHGQAVMTTKYCLKYQLGHCPREGGTPLENEPLSLLNEDGRRLHLQFDCAACVMKVMYE